MYFVVEASCLHVAVDVLVKMSMNTLYDPCVARHFSAFVSSPARSSQRGKSPLNNQDTVGTYTSRQQNSSSIENTYIFTLHHNQKGESTIEHSFRPEKNAHIVE